MIPTDDLLGIPYKLGGREFSRTGGTDCLGICGVVCERAGKRLPDPWRDVGKSWRENPLQVEVEEAQGSGWERCEFPYIEGDVALVENGRGLMAYIGDGWWMTARAHAGVVRVPWPHPIPIVYRYTGDSA